MLSKKTYFTLVILLELFVSNTKAQLYFDIGNYRNTIYTTTGYNGAFGNVTVGAVRRDYIRLIKKEVTGILDISLPVSHVFFTRQIIRKGFQVTIYKKDDFKIPFTFASSSIIRHDNFVKYHDVTAEFTFNPGIYTKVYTLALDMRYELIAFRHAKYSDKYRHDVDRQAHNHWNEPLFNIFKCGLVAGLNFKKTVLYLKTGYEGKPALSKYLPGYVVLGFGFKCGTKPLKKENAAVK